MQNSMVGVNKIENVKELLIMIINQFACLISIQDIRFKRWYISHKN